MKKDGFSANGWMKWVYRQKWKQDEEKTNKKGGWKEGRKEGQRVKWNFDLNFTLCTKVSAEFIVGLNAKLSMKPFIAYLSLLWYAYIWNIYNYNF